jgi:hypothetical protein
MSEKVEQKFQSQGKLFPLKVDAVWEKFENVILFPFRWLADSMGQTDAFRERGVTLRVVK